MNDTKSKLREKIYKVIGGSYSIHESNIDKALKELSYNDSNAIMNGLYLLEKYRKLGITVVDDNFKFVLGLK